MHGRRHDSHATLRPRGLDPGGPCVLRETGRRVGLYRLPRLRRPGEACRQGADGARVPAGVHGVHPRIQSPGVGRSRPRLHGDRRRARRHLHHVFAVRGSLHRRSRRIAGRARRERGAMGQGSQGACDPPPPRVGRHHGGDSGRRPAGAHVGRVPREGRGRHGRRVLRATARARARQSGHAHLHLRNHRAPEGGHALAREPRLDRHQRDHDRDGARERPQSVVFAALAHRRADGLDPRAHHRRVGGLLRRVARPGAGPPQGDSPDDLLRRAAHLGEVPRGSLGEAGRSQGGQEVSRPLGSLRRPPGERTSDARRVPAAPSRGAIPCGQPARVLEAEAGPRPRPRPGLRHGRGADRSERCSSSSPRSTSSSAARATGCPRTRGRRPGTSATP